MTTRKKWFLVIILLVQVSILWPVYPLFSSAFPLIFGLPLSFAWVVAMLIVSFLTVLWFYLTDPELHNPES